MKGESDRSLKFGKSAGMWLFNDRGWDHEDNLGAPPCLGDPCIYALLTSSHRLDLLADLLSSCSVPCSAIVRVVCTAQGWPVLPSACS